MLQNERVSYVCYLMMLSTLILSTIYHIDPNISIVIYTFCLIYIGSVQSLKVFSESELLKSEENVETMSRKDAMMFPIIG